MQNFSHAWINFIQSLRFLSPVDFLSELFPEGGSCVSAYMFFFFFFWAGNDVIDPKACELLSHRWIWTCLRSLHPAVISFSFLFSPDKCQCCSDHLTTWTCIGLLCCCWFLHAYTSNFPKIHSSLCSWSFFTFICSSFVVLVHICISIPVCSLIVHT